MAKARKKKADAGMRSPNQEKYYGKKRTELPLMEEEFSDRLKDSIDQAKVEEERVDLIDDGNQARKPGTDLGIKQLATSMSLIGQLAPIGIMPAATVGDRYTVIWGHRRLAAARSLGWQTIKVIKLGIGTAQAVLAVTENIERSPLTPLEEAIAVHEVVMATGRVESAALILGRSESWVRDRGYILNLCEEVKEMLHAGDITLGHARLLAMVTDHKKQFEMARWCGNCPINVIDDATALAKWREESRGSIHMRSLADLRHYIKCEQRDLTRVPWPLDARFADRQPCIGCPWSTHVNKLLFDVGDGEGARCTNEECFSKKMEAAERKPMTATKPAAQENDSTNEYGVGKSHKKEWEEFPTLDAKITRRLRAAEDFVQAQARKNPWVFLFACDPINKLTLEEQVSACKVKSGEEFATWLTEVHKATQSFESQYSWGDELTRVASALGWDGGEEKLPPSLAPANGQ